MDTKPPSAFNQRVSRGFLGIKESGVWKPKVFIAKR
jgi:hypothetical protein